MVGNYFTMQGEREARAGVLATEEASDRELKETVEDISDFAGNALRTHAPGNISLLVDTTGASRDIRGGWEAFAGVEPKLTSRLVAGEGDTGLGSDPGDYPIYVDQGTGIFGPLNRIIETIPGNLMVFDYAGRTIFTPRVRGQRAQNFSELAFMETVAYAPERIARFGPPVMLP